MPFGGSTRKAWSACLAAGLRRRRKKQHLGVLFLAFGQSAGGNGKTKQTTAEIAVSDYPPALPDRLMPKIQGARRESIYHGDCLQLGRLLASQEPESAKIGVNVHKAGNRLC
jgi:hypothetical protein